jgi:hypothetical protein
MNMLKKGNINIARAILIILFTTFSISCGSTSHQITSVNSADTIYTSFGNLLVSNKFKRIEQQDNSFKFMSDDGRLLHFLVPQKACFESVAEESDTQDISGENSIFFKSGKSWQYDITIEDIPLTQLGDLPGTGYIQKVETGTGYAITPNGLTYFAQKNPNEAFLDLTLEDTDNSSTDALYAALNGIKYEVKQKQPENCIEADIEWLNDIGFGYCITRFQSEYTVKYTYGTLSIIYTEKTDDLKSFKQNCKLSKLVSFEQK